MTTMASQSTSLTVVYSTLYSDTDQRKHQSSASLAFVWGMHRTGTGEFPAQRTSYAGMYPFDDVIMLIKEWVTMMRQVVLQAWIYKPMESPGACWCLSMTIQLDHHCACCVLGIKPLHEQMLIIGHFPLRKIYNNDIHEKLLFAKRQSTLGQPTNKRI